MLRNPRILRGPQTKGDEIRSGCLTPAFLGAQKGADMLRSPCILGGPQTKGDEIRSGCLTLPSRGPKRGRKCDITPAFSGIPKQRGTKSEGKTYARGNNDAPSISKYGSLVQLDAQIVALR